MSSLATVASAKPGAISPRHEFSMDELERLAARMAKTTLVPKIFQGNPDNCLIAMLMGRELGIGEMQSVQNIAVVNGSPKVWGDMTLALVMNNPAYVNIETGWDEKTLTAHCTVERRGHKPHTVRFSMEDAKRMGLAGKETYKADPVRMCTWRAKQRALSDMFPDSLKGMAVISADVEPEEIYMGAAVVEPPDAMRVMQLIDGATSRDELSAAAELAKQLPEEQKSEALRRAFKAKSEKLATVDDDGLVREPVAA